MGNSNMKNIVVLKNLPSNMVDEAIVILKNNKYAKKFEYVDNISKSNINEKERTKDYIIKEAESVIANYISKVEKGKSDSTQKVSDFNIEKKYKKLKIYSVVASIVLIACFISVMI